MAAIYDPVPLATMLAEAWKSGVPLKAMPPASRPRDLENGYAVQDRLVRELGFATVGWKLGGASLNARRQNGVAVPIVGALLGPGSYRSGDRVVLIGRQPFVVEFEIAFVFGRDCPPGTTEPDVFSSVTAYAAFEIVQSRLDPMAQTGIAMTLADNASARAHVLGGSVDLARLGDLLADLTVRLDGRAVAGAVTGGDLVSPQHGLREFLDLAWQRGFFPCKDQVLLTGSLSVPFSVSSGKGDLEARFSGMHLNCKVRN